MKHTVLHDTHVEMGARMVPFAGYEMPVQYDSPLAEHHAVRQNVGLFDIDHMGQVVVTGPDAVAFLNHIATNDARDLAPGESQYSIMCYADGGVVDDIFIYRRPDDYFVVINADNRTKDLRWMNAHAVGFDVALQDVSDETCMLALQGPWAQATLQTLTETNLEALRFHHAETMTVAGVEAFVGATGYTGEYGYELYFDAEHAVEMWHTLLEAGDPFGIKPCGLAARDSLRFEACLALYGHELTADISPLEAGLSYFVKLNKGEFIGRDALLKQKLEAPPRRLACLEMVERGVPREGYPVHIDGEQGIVTTGMYAPTADLYGALALIPRELYKLGKTVQVEIRGKLKDATIVRRPFYTPAYRG